MSTTTYREQSRAFLAQASEELERGDLRQASEKGWGAAAQIVKAAADARGWEHDRHATLFRVVRELADESGDAELRYMFAVAGELHSNFYERFLDVEDVEAYLHRVAAFVDRVETLLPEGLNGEKG